MTDPLPDWLSPIIVKELRQGLRSRSFTLLLGLTQAAMLLCVFITLEVATAPNGGQGAAVFFWVVVGGILLFGLPLQALGAVAGEIKANTLELLTLTPLSTWRIAAGKWAALFLQALLLVITLFPYLVLRYFIGGLDLMQEVAILFLLLAGSAVLTAVGVGLSPLAHRPLGRVLLAVGAVISFNFIPPLLVGGGLLRSTVLPFGYWLTLALVLVPLVVLQALEIGVSRIAPPGEDTTSRRRLFALGLATMAAGLGVVWNERAASTLIGAVLVFPVALGALLEPALLIPTLYEPPRWARRNRFLRRFAALVLEPGLASGAAFVALLAGILFVSSGYRMTQEGINQALFFGLGMFLVPLALARATRRPPLPIYLVLQGAGFLLFIYVLLFHRNGFLADLSGFYPTTAFLLHLADGVRGGASSGAVRVFLCGVAILAALGALGRLAWRERRAIARLREDEDAA